MRAGASRGVSDGSPRPAVAADRGQERPGGRLEPRAGVGAGRFERLRGRHRLGDHPRTAAQLGCGDENAYPSAERWVQTVRRDLLEHVIVLNERHLHRLLSEFVAYYHDDRTHLALGKSTPTMRTATSNPSSDAEIVGHPRVGGLHHRYEWRQAA